MPYAMNSYLQGSYCGQKVRGKWQNIDLTILYDTANLAWYKNCKLQAHM